MTQPNVQQQRQRTVTEIAPLLATGASIAALTPTLIPSLAAVGVSAAAASAALTLIGASSASTVLLPTGTASRATAASENFYRATYLVAAAERIQSRINQGMTVRQAVLAERGNFQAHLAASANRRRTAQTVDAAAQRYGSVLGWRAVMDDRTSAECARANGKNFSVYDRPAIGWPGSVHPACRCRPTLAYAGAGLVNDVATEVERREAVA